jgi:TolA-binding protein
MRINLPTVFAFFLFISISGFSQQQIYFDASNNLLRESIELIQKEQYGAARFKINQIQRLDGGLSKITLSDLAYYDALCAVQLNDQDAAEKIEDFGRQHRSSQWSARMIFLEGRVQFEEKRYTKALEAFNKVEIDQLPSFEKAELDYKKGFCLMKQNNIEEALLSFEAASKIESPFRNASTYYLGHLFYTMNEDQKAEAAFQSIRHITQYKKIIPYYELQMAYRRGDYSMVNDKGKEILLKSDTKKRAEVLPLLADAAYKNGERAIALEFYNQLEKQHRGQLNRIDEYQKAMIYYETGNYKDAAAGFQKINNDNDSLDQSAAYFLAQCYLKTDQKIFARQAFLSAFKNKSDTEISHDALMNYSRLSLEIGSDNYNEATVLLQEFITANPKSPLANEAQQLLVQHYLTTKNYDAALESLETNKKNDPKLQAVYEKLVFSLATDLFNESQFDQAITYFSKVNPSGTGENNAAALFWTAEAFYRKKNYVDAQKFYKQFMAHRSAAKSPLKPLAHYNLAYSYFQLTQYGPAMASFKQYLEKPLTDQPQLRTDSWCRVGDCHFINREYTKAIEAYKNVINAGEQQTDYALYQSGLAYGALGQHNQKIAQLDQIVKRFNQSIYYDQALYEMGATHLVMNDQRSAISSFDKLVRERPRSVYAREAQLKIGFIYFNNNQTDEAIVALQKVAESYPGTPDAREALNTLKVIYMESNNIDAYFKLTKKLGFGELSNNEQESLTFATGENFYNENRFAEARQALEGYLKNFPQGSNAVSANYYLAKIKLPTSTDEALSHFNVVILSSNNPYLEEALLEAARIYYDKEMYPESQKNYEQLFSLTDQPLQKIEALEGMMKCSFFNKKYADAIGFSEKLLNNSNAGPKQLRQAHYIAGKSMFETNDYDGAKKQFSEVHKSENDVLGAEAYYLMALINFNKGYLDDAENQIFDLSEKYRRHEYWVAKGFILLADIYVKNDNIFQAKETLKSIVENYKGSDLRDEAARKLSMLQ